MKEGGGKHVIVKEHKTRKPKITQLKPTSRDKNMKILQEKRRKTIILVI